MIGVMGIPNMFLKITKKNCIFWEGWRSAVILGRGGEWGLPVFSKSKTSRGKKRTVEFKM